MPNTRELNWPNKGAKCTEVKSGLNLNHQLTSLVAIVQYIIGKSNPDNSYTNILLQAVDEPSALCCLVLLGSVRGTTQSLGRK